MKKCLVIKVGAIGDCLRITPIIHTLNDLDFEIDIFTSNLSAPLFINNPFIKKIYTIKHYHNFLMMWWLFKKLKNISYDLVVNFETNTKILNQAKKLNYEKYLDFFNTISISNAQNIKNIYDINYIILTTLTNNLKKYRYEIYPSADEKIRVLNFLKNYSNKNKIAIHIGSAKTNRWLNKNQKDVRLWQ
ncbi:MAG TPA: hypothetical protein PLM75_06320, partial [bacterium]|nr:hypothetical protein [bacterium]